MPFKQVVKYRRNSAPYKSVAQEARVEDAEPKKNNPKKADEMDEKVNRAEEIMNNMKAANHVKIVKKDKGLIERTESSKIVLTEDNRQVLND
jgi:hypothetical protein